MRASLRFIAILAATAAFLIPAAGASAQACLVCSYNPPIVPGPIQISQGQQLVADSSFEDPNLRSASGLPVWWGYLNQYTQLSATSFPRAHCTNTPTAMYVGGYSGAGALTTVQDAGYVEQRITVPAGATSTYLDFYVYFPNQLHEVEQLAVLAVSQANVPGPFSGQPIPWVTLQTNSNQTTSKNAWVHVSGIPMGQFAGQNAFLKFQLRTDQQYPEPSQIMPVVTPNGIFLDDVSVWTGPSSIINLCL